MIYSYIFRKIIFDSIYDLTTSISIHYVGISKPLINSNIAQDLHSTYYVAPHSADLPLLVSGSKIVITPSMLSLRSITDKAMHLLLMSFSRQFLLLWSWYRNDVRNVHWKSRDR